MKKRWRPGDWGVEGVAPGPGSLRPIGLEAPLGPPPLGPPRVPPGFLGGPPLGPQGPPGGPQDY